MVNQFPFEISEKGWGEFEVKMKVYFVDPQEKVLHLTHFLRLYPSEDVCAVKHPPSNKNMVITEQYDEIVRIF